MPPGSRHKETQTFVKSTKKRLYKSQQKSSLCTTATSVMHPVTKDNVLPPMI